MGRKSDDDDARLAAAARRLYAAPPNGNPVSSRRSQRFNALMLALDAFPMLQHDELGWHQLEPHDLLVALGLVLRHAYIRLAELYRHDKGIAVAFNRTAAGRRVLARIAAGELPPPVHARHQALRPAARRAVDKALSAVFGEAGESGCAAPGSDDGR